MIDATWPIVINGSSTGCPPIHVRTSALAVIDQNSICVSGRNMFVRWGVLWVSGIINRMAIDITKAKTPPSLLGMDRRMA